MGPGTSSRLAWWIGLAALFAGAAYLRFDAIGWGAPFVYHPDEHFILHPALEIVRTGDPNPHWFQYPSLLIYLEAALIALLRPFTEASLQSNHLVNGIGPWEALPSQWPFVYAGRLLVAVCAVASVLLLARAGERLYGTAAGLIAGAFLMLAVLHNQAGHYLTTDVPSATFLIACLAATAARRPHWLLAGILAGLAAGTKYTAGVAVLAPVLAAIEPSRPGETLSRWSTIFVGSLGAFLVSTPYAIFDAGAFVEGLAQQRQNYFAWKGQTGNLGWYVEYLYSVGLRQVVAVLAIAGAVCLLVRIVTRLRRGESVSLDLAVLLPPLLYVPWIASYPSRAERNLIVVLPFLCLWAAVGARRVSAAVRPPWLGAAVLAVVLAASFAISLPPLRNFNRMLQQPDNRTLALEWLRANVPRGTKIVREEYTPQVPTDEYDVTYLFSLARQPYSQYLGQRVQYLIASSNIYGRSVEPPYIGGDTARAFYEVLFTLPLVKEFPKGPFSNGPTIRIYRVPLPDAVPRENAASSSS